MWHTCRSYVGSFETMTNEMHLSHLAHEKVTQPGVILVELEKAHGTA